MDEGDALGFGGEEIVVAAGLQQLQHGFGTSHSQLSVTKADKGANVQIVRYLADRQLPLQTGYCQRICMHKITPFAPKAPDITKAHPERGAAAEERIIA